MENPLTAHTINNIAPICSLYNDPSQALYEPKKIISYLNRIPKLDNNMRGKHKLLQSMNYYANLSNIERGNYLDSLCTLRNITKEDCKSDNLPPILIGQKGVFAAKNIPAFTLLGFYSGIYFTSEEQEDEYIKNHGDSYNTYSFGLINVEYPKISGFKYGNCLTCINAGTVYSGSAHKIAQEIYQKCNVSYMYTKSLEYPDKEFVADSDNYDLVSYVTNRAVKKGEQLLVNYGMRYWSGRTEDFTTASEDDISNMLNKFNNRNKKNFKKIYSRK